MIFWLFFPPFTCRWASTRQQKTDTTHHPEKSVYKNMNSILIAFSLSWSMKILFHVHSRNTYSKYRHQLLRLGFFSFEIGILFFSASSSSRFLLCGPFLRSFLLSLIKKANIMNPQLVAVHDFISRSLMVMMQWQ